MRIYILTIFSKLFYYKTAIPVIMILIFLFLKIRKFRLILFFSIFIYTIYFGAFFPLKNYGIDSVTLCRMKFNLTSLAYFSYKQDIELMKTFRDKRNFSLFMFYNSHLFNEEFNIIEKFLKEEKKNEKELKLEHLNSNIRII